MDKPGQMQAVVTETYGSSETMQVKQTARPVAGLNQYLIRVRASSVNPIDWKLLNGSLKIITGRKPPRILGGDFAGEVVEAGSNVSTYKVGDEVFGLIPANKGGAYAQYIAVQDASMALKPKNISFEEAAAIPLAGLTAYQALVHEAGVARGGHVMVNGCSGGVGHLAVQIAKALECQVTGVCSARNRELAEQLGADRVVDYAKEDVLQGEGCYDVFFDSVGNQSFSSAKGTLKPAGTYVTTLPNASSMILGPMINLVSAKKSKKILVVPNAADLATLSDFVSRGLLKVVLEKTFAMEDIAEAHNYSQGGRVVGKLAITLA
jgi:NADPH:quinone reductase-like Zn-dependent oxidoreductase